MFNKMTKDLHNGFHLPVVLPKGDVVGKTKRRELVEKYGIDENYAKEFREFGGQVHQPLVNAIEGLKKFAKEESGDLKCLCSSVTITVDCSDAIRNAEVYDLLDVGEQNKMKEEARASFNADIHFSYHSFLHKMAYERHSKNFLEKVKCGKKIKVEPSWSFNWFE